MYIKNPIVQKIYKKKKSRSGKTTLDKKPIGILVAGIDYKNPNNVVVGYSLCHRKDKFDHVEFEGVVIHKPGFGKELAVTRALDWAEETHKPIPPSIFKNVTKFTDRCRKYYKGAKLPMWTAIPEKMIADGVREIDPTESLEGC